MSAEQPGTATPPALPVLGVNERRVLGVLVEKAKTTPDSYPLSLNALVTGSNQKSNRDPLLDLNDLDVEDALANCQKKGLVFKITGGRVERWKHNLYEAWLLNKVELAILGELLLRGAQTEGELRARVCRMEPVDDLDTLRARLRPLAERKLVVYLSPEGRRGTTVTHGFHTARELERLRSNLPAEPATGDSEAAEAFVSPAASSPPIKSTSENELQALRAEIADLRAQLAETRTAVAVAQAEIAQLKSSLGG